MRFASCQSCGARIIWAATPAGKRVPLDAFPQDEGTIALVKGNKEMPEATFLKKHEAEVARDAGRRLFVSHFSTCPNASLHRNRRGEKR